MTFASFKVLPLWQRLIFIFGLFSSVDLAIKLAVFVFIVFSYILG